jgi:hypothetical protein
MALTREEILALDDLTIKEITVPDNIPTWGGKTLFIKQLSRGLQDGYLKRVRGQAIFKSDKRKSNQEVTGMTVDGHDAWLVVKGACDSEGRPLFKEADTEALNAKSGEAIGWVAAQIIEFSGMKEDAKVASGEITEEEATADELKS